MSPETKRAYRYVIYFVALDIRSLSWFAWSWREKIDPFYLIRQIARIRAKGALADWIHNLAHYSALEFERFDEKRFWDEYVDLARIHQRHWDRDYRKFFEDRGEEFRNEKGA
jgi:hypothetical protein